MRNLIETITNVFDSHTSCILTPIQSKENSPLKILAWTSFSKHFNPHAIIPADIGLISHAYREQKSIHFNHFEKDPQRLFIYSGDLEIKAVLITPIPEKKGIIYIDSKNKHAFPEKSKKILENFAKVAYNILNLLKNQCEMEFYGKLSEFLLKKYNNLIELIQSICNLTSLNNALLIKKQLKSMEIVYNNAFLLNDKIKDTTGLLELIINSQKSIFISTSGFNKLPLIKTIDDTKVRYIISLYINLKIEEYYFILAGEKKTIGFTRDKLPLLERVISQIFLSL